MEAGKYVVVEKSFTEYFGSPGDKNFKGNIFPKEKMLAASDVVSVLYAAYLSAERKGTEVEIPINSSL